MRHFAGEAFETVTDVDGTVLRTMRTLLAKPGELTAAYMRGVRIPYMKPLQLFIIINVVYFIWSAWAGERVFDTPLSVHFKNSNYGLTASQLVADRVRSPGITAATFGDALREYTVRFNDTASVHAKSLIFIMAPMLALLIAVVEWRRREPFVKHLVFAVHAYTALLVLAIVQRYVVHIPIRLVGGVLGAPPGEQLLNEVIGLVMMSAMAIYIIAGLRRAYSDSWPFALLKGAFLGWMLLPILGLYRYILFYTVFWTV